MKYPKLLIASDGRYTGILLDGVFMGDGIRRLEFSACGPKNGSTAKSVIRLLDVDVDEVNLSDGEDRFIKFATALGETTARTIQKRHGHVKVSPRT